MSKKKLVGASIAAAAALTFVSAPLSTAFAADGDQVHCYGVNKCKGTSACKTAKSVCKGHNACKGQGFVMKSEADCKAAGGRTTES